MRIVVLLKYAPTDREGDAVGGTQETTRMAGAIGVQNGQTPLGRAAARVGGRNG